MSAVVTITLPPVQIAVPAATIRRVRRMIGDMDAATWDDDEVGQYLLDHVFTDGLGVVSYDLYAAAADLLEAEVAELRRKFDTTDASGSTMKRSQIGVATLALAAQYRAQQRAVSVSVARSDVA